MSDPRSSLPALVKICGLRTESAVRQAIESGADRVGFVLVASSPRHVDFGTAKALIQLAVELDADPWVVTGWKADGAKGQDALEQFIADTPEVGAIQLHGGETPADVAHFSQRFLFAPIVKAIGVSSRRDLDQVEEFPWADEFLFDAKPPKGASREGGHGASFDWTLLRNFDAGDNREWTLSGGLTPENVARAIGASGARAVDVSSGVESSPGVKDPAKVKAFIDAVKAAR